MKTPGSVKKRKHSSLLSPQNTLPRLALTLGDPAGIGPEVVLKALAHPTLQKAAQFTLVGDPIFLEGLLTRLTQQGINLTLPSSVALVEPSSNALSLAGVTPGCPTPATGKASFQFLEKAIAGALVGDFDAIVTGPIAKSVWHAAGHVYPGQTEVCAERADVQSFGMLFAARSPHTGWLLRTLLATTHIPLNQVPEALSPALMTHKLTLLINSLSQDFGIQAPHIAISGLNPHSGEAGKLGTEEQDWLIPWMEEAQARYPHIRLTGPVPPDTLWVSAGAAWYEDTVASPYDAYLALYHDQGLIPVKLLAFDRAVNTTIGLPFIRTSPDHGTAFDIAGQGIARSDSMEAAIELAIALTKQRQTCTD
ncbi:MAG: 4-hydroxythreonine-4-phosphate dehydrogenase PdxA [Cyanobacteria bacterium J06638_28]